jgi:DNA-binding IclR family transcriptional regulator
VSEIVEEAARSDRAQGVQVLSRAAEILRLLKMNSSGLTQAEIAGKLGLARTTVHRLLKALAEEDFVQAVASTNRYRLGGEIVHLADAVRSALVAEVHPILQRLSNDIDETVDLSILDKAHATFIDQVVAPQRLRAVSVVGASFPLHCTANGKAILAQLPAPEAERLLGVQLEKLTPNSITDRVKLMRELAEIGPKGVAFDREEHSVGICAVGMAVGQTPFGLGAISVPMPVQRFSAKIDAVTRALTAAARQARSILKT